MGFAPKKDLLNNSLVKMSSKAVEGKPKEERAVEQIYAKPLTQTGILDNAVIQFESPENKGPSDSIDRHDGTGSPLKLESPDRKIIGNNGSGPFDTGSLEVQMFVPKINFDEHDFNNAGRENFTIRAKPVESLVNSGEEKTLSSLVAGSRRENKETSQIKHARQDELGFSGFEVTESLVETRPSIPKKNPGEFGQGKELALLPSPDQTFKAKPLDSDTKKERVPLFEIPEEDAH